jgi:hypothetical protein
VETVVVMISVYLNIEWIQAKVIYTYSSYSNCLTERQRIHEYINTSIFHFILNQWQQQKMTNNKKGKEFCIKCISKMTLDARP